MYDLKHLKIANHSFDDWKEIFIFSLSKKLYQYHYIPVCGNYAGFYPCRVYLPVSVCLSIWKLRHFKVWVVILSSDTLTWSMLEIFGELQGLLHVSHVHIDSWVFRLHYSITTTCMFAFSLIVSATQYVGNPIDCIHTNDIPEVSDFNKYLVLLFLLFVFPIFSIIWFW